MSVYGFSLVELLCMMGMLGVTILLYRGPRMKLTYKRKWMYFIFLLLGCAIIWKAVLLWEAVKMYQINQKTTKEALLYDISVHGEKTMQDTPIESAQGYTATVPRGYTYLVYDGIHPNISLVFVKKFAGAPLVSFTVSVFGAGMVSDPHQPELVAGDLIRQLRNTNPSYVFFPGKASERGGLSCYELDFTVALSRVSARGKLLLISAHNRIYTVTFSAPQGVFNQYLTVYQHFIDSLHFF